MAAPAVDRGFVNAEDVGDEGGGLTLIQQLDCSPPPPFQFSCCSYWSGHALLYGCPV